MDPVITVDGDGSQPDRCREPSPLIALVGLVEGYSAVAGSVPSSLDEESAASIGAANRSTQSSLAQVRRPRVSSGFRLPSDEDRSDPHTGSMPLDQMPLQAQGLVVVGGRDPSRVAPSRLRP